jgi:hypothetical protein
MANSQIDVSMDPDISDIVHTAAGTVTNDVRVVIAESADKHEAYRTLIAIADALVSDQITLE